MDIKIEKRILKNGMAIYFYPDLTKHSVSVNLVVKAGGQDKDFYYNGEEYHYADGMAHFLEHLLIEHSQFGNLVNALGNHQIASNGGTNPITTQYFFETSKDLEFGIETLIKGIEQPVFTEEDIDKTKNAIYEEIRMSRDKKGRTIWESSNENLYHNIDYINNLGSIENIENITYQQVKLYYEAYYQAKNQFLVIGGNFDVEKIWEFLQKLEKEINFSKGEFKAYDYKEPKEVLNKEVLISRPTSEPIVELIYKIDVSSFTSSQINRLSYYLAYFDRMNFSKNSKLYKKLIKEEITHQSTWSNVELSHGFFILKIGGYTNEKEKFVKAVRNVIKKPTFDEELFELYKAREKMDICCQAESYQYVLNALITNITVFNRDDLEDVEYINSFTMEEFKEYIQMLDFNHYLILHLIDEEEI